MNNSKSEFPRDGSVLVVVTARMRSARCPGKVLAELAGKPLIEHLLERMVWVAGREQVVLATSESPENKILVELAESLGVAGFIGDEEDVLGRHVEVARRYEAEHVVRVTGDNPPSDLSNRLPHYSWRRGRITPMFQATRYLWASCQSLSPGRH